MTEVLPFQCHGVLEAHIFDHTIRVGVGLKIGNTDVLHGQTAVASTLAEEAHADGVEFRYMRIIIEAWPISQELVLLEALFDSTALSQSGALLGKN